MVLTTSAPPSTALPATADVLVVGAGPIGLTAAYELRRRGIDVVIVDRLLAVAPYAKAVGIQPRTVDPGIRPAWPDPRWTPPRRCAARSPSAVGRRPVGSSCSCRTTCPTASPACDGAHSLVRKGLDIGFEGDAFPEAYLLGDVELDWDLPFGYAIRASRPVEGQPDDIMVCIPLPGGQQRYRVSSLVDPELATAPSPAPVGDGVTHGLQSGPAPELRHIQAVLDRLSPQPTKASRLRWSSVLRISHRLASSHGAGRAFLAGDAALIHPPTGAQGMNTGIQDAINLAWKVAHAVRGEAAEDLLESDHAERHPVGEEVVGRTVRSARSGIESDGSDFATLMAREAQLLVGYPDSPLVGEDRAGELTGPVPGQRATDAGGLMQDATGYPIRLHTRFRHPGHALLLWAGDPAALTLHQRITAALGTALPGAVHCYVITGQGVTADASGTVLRDAGGAFARTYGTASADAAAYLIRPDGYVSYRTGAPTAEAILAHLRKTLAW